MKDLTEILEEEFSEAVEVKNPKSLHRCFALLTGTYVEQETHERRYNELSIPSTKVSANFLRHAGFYSQNYHS